MHKVDRMNGHFRVNYGNIIKVSGERLYHDEETSSQVAVSSLVPRPSPFFVLMFALSIIHGRGRVAKNREGLHGNTYHVTWT